MWIINSSLSRRKKRKELVITDTLGARVRDAGAEETWKDKMTCCLHLQQY
jgi:hypothetical protein